MAQNKANYQIVASKFNRPAVDSKWVARPRLISLLGKSLNKRITIISAPAGYGKTTLAAQWLDHIPHPSAWLSLDEYDSDPDLFLQYVIASIRQVFPQFGSRIVPLLSSPTLPSPNYVADMLISDLTALAKPLVLVFDDFHFIKSKPAHIISRLVRHLPDCLHLVIATRADPPLPLAQWRVRDWLTEIRAADLRFSPVEAQSYFETYFEGQLSDACIERIAARAEGWVAGLQMAKISLTESDEPEALAMRFSGSDRMVVDFLMDEVLSRQPDDIKHFLAVTSMLKRFCASLCDHLLEEEKGIGDSRRLIDLLKKENLFLVPLDGDVVWYRYHHLFQELLGYQMKTVLSQNLKTQVHRRAGEWFADQGQIEDALRHRIAAGDLDEAAALVEENMHAILDQDLSRRTLGRWLDMFPGEAEKQQPALLVAHAFQKFTYWDLTGLASLLDQAESLLTELKPVIPETRRQSLLGDILALRACCLYWQGDVEGALRHARRGMKIVPKEHRYAHSLAVVYAAGSVALLGQMEDALLLLDEALEADCSDGSPNAAHFLFSKAVIYSYSADLAAVERSVMKVLEVHKTAPQSDYWLGYAPYFLGRTAYERNLLDVAADQFGRIEQLRYRVNTRLYHDALIGLTLVALAKSDRDSAENYAAEAYSFAIEVNDALSMRISDSIQLRLALCSGNVPADPPPFKPAVESTWFWIEFPSLTHAEYLVNSGNHRDCSAGLEAIEKGLQMARHHHRTWLELQFLAVKAVALKCAGRTNDALELLEKTLDMAEPHGLVRSFVDRGPHMAELLRAFSETRPENPYARSLLDAFGDKAPPLEPAANAADNPSRTEPSSEPFISNGLSNRELDVLMLLSRRLANKEIAERLKISPITVKAHTASIYRKLNVHGRRQAAVRAEQLGLLTEFGG